MSVAIEHVEPPCATNQRRSGLRQADWRFLLPAARSGAFEHLVLLGGPSGLSGHILECGLARRVSRSLPGSTPADAVILLSDSTTAPDEAARHVREGGVFYCEVDRRSPGRRWLSVDRLAGRLGTLGLTVTARYWIKPSCRRPEMYLTLDAQQALAWYVDTLYTANSPPRRLAEPLLRLAGRFGGAPLGQLAPCYALAAVAGPAHQPPTLLVNPALPFTGRKLHCVLLTGLEDDRSRVVMLPFEPEQRAPVAVLKLSRRPEFNRFNESEQRALNEVRRLISPRLAATLPEPLGLIRHGRLAVSMESYAAGRSLSTSIGRWQAPFARRVADLHLATDWLAELHRETARDWLALSARREEWIERPLREYGRAFGLSKEEAALFTLARERANLLNGSPLPLVWQHHDFGEWNVYRQGDRLKVLDWERGRFGPPLCDLFHFVTEWSFSMRRLIGEPAQLRGFGEIYAQPEHRERSVNAARQALTRYLDGLGIDRRFLPLLLVQTWAARAVERLERKIEVGERPDDPRAGNPYVAYIGVLAAGAEPLFGAWPVSRAKSGFAAGRPFR